MTNDALKMPDEIYLLHNEGDMGEHLWCENIPNDEMEFTKYIRADRAALVPVDVEGLANYIRAINGDNTMGAGELAEKITDHLAARGFGVPEGYVLLPINPTREAVCQRIAISFDEDCASHGNVVKTMGRNLSESRITVIFTPSQLREIYGLMVKAMIEAAPKKEGV